MSDLRNTGNPPLTEHGAGLFGARYRTVVADPPWPYGIRGPASSREHRPNSHGAATSSVERYGSLSIEGICSLAPPVEDAAHLYLWFTNSFAVEAHEVARSWGFEPKTILTWVKMKSDGSPSMKTGFYFRGATEHVLFCVRGSLRLQTKVAYPTVFFGPRLAHSVKPGAFFDLVKDASPGPYLEMFARHKRSGWDVWGDEVDSDLEVVA